MFPATHLLTHTSISPTLSSVPPSASHFLSVSLPSRSTSSPTFSIPTALLPLPRYHLPFPFPWVNFGSTHSQQPSVTSRGPSVLAGCRGLPGWTTPIQQLQLQPHSQNCSLPEHMTNTYQNNYFLTAKTLEKQYLSQEHYLCPEFCSLWIWVVFTGNVSLAQKPRNQMTRTVYTKLSLFRSKA